MIEDAPAGTGSQHEDTSSDMSFDMNPTFVSDDEAPQEAAPSVAPTPPPAAPTTDSADEDAGSGLSLELEDDTNGQDDAPSMNPDAAPAPADAAAKEEPAGPPPGGKRLPLGERLIESNVIDRDQLNIALQQKKQMPEKMIGEILVDLGFVTADEL